MTNDVDAADLERGVEALRAGASSDAKQLLAQLAQEGNASAQYYMGRACEAQYGDQAPHDAVAWYRQAIAGGSFEAVCALGRLYLYDDEFGLIEKSEARELLQKAASHFEEKARAGHAPSQCRYGKMMVMGDGVGPDRVNGLAWWRRGAALAGPGWQVALAGELWDDEGNTRARTEALRWFERAAAGGHSGAAYFLGAAYASGDGIRRDYAKAVRWYETAMERGDTEARYNLGCMYCSGEGVSVDLEYGRRLLLEAGEMGNWNALFLLKDAYRDAFWGFPRDAALAAHWDAEYARIVVESR